MFEAFKAGRPVFLGLLLAFSAGALQVAHADDRYREHEYREHEFHQQQYLDARYHHDHYYPPHGFVFGVYYYANATYYVQSPGGYTVVAPPPSNVVVEQPPANGVVVGQPAQAPVVPQPPPATVAQGPDQVFIYPKNGQGEQQQATDRYECHRWAVSQTGFDPTLSAGAAPQKHTDYQRALGACLEGRGYTVK